MCLVLPLAVKGVQVVSSQTETTAHPHGQSVLSRAFQSVFANDLPQAQAQKYYY